MAALFDSAARPRFLGLFGFGVPAFRGRFTGTRGLGIGGRWCGGGFGTLEAGKYADLVVLDANPLQDIENARKISSVMKAGKTIDIGQLPRHPILTSSEAENPGPVRMK